MLNEFAQRMHTIVLSSHSFFHARDRLRKNGGLSSHGDRIELTSLANVSLRTKHSSIPKYGVLPSNRRYRTGVVD